VQISKPFLETDMSDLNQNSGANLRDKLDSSASTRLNSDMQRRDDSLQATAQRRKEQRNLAKGVAQAAMNLQLQLGEITEQRVKSARKLASERLKEAKARALEVRSNLKSIQSTRLESGRKRANARAVDRENVTLETGQILEAANTARAVLRENLNAFSEQMHRNKTGAAPRPRVVRAKTPAPASTGSANANASAMGAGEAALSAVSRRRENVVVKAVTGTPGITMKDLENDLKLEASELKAVMRRLVTAGRVTSQDGGYHPGKVSE
jgi:hypothetical protein